MPEGGFAPDGFALLAAPGLLWPGGEDEPGGEEDGEPCDDDEPLEDDEDGGFGGEGADGCDGIDVGVGIGGGLLELELVVAQPAIHIAHAVMAVRRRAFLIFALLGAHFRGFGGV